MSSGRDQPRKWIVEEHAECPASFADMAARVRDPSIFLYLSIDPDCVDAWERSRIDDGDLSPDWVEWWLKSARALGNAGLYCVLAYIPNRRSLFRRPDLEFAPLAMGDLLGLLVDGLHWGVPRKGGCFGRDRVLPRVVGVAMTAAFFPGKGRASSSRTRRVISR